MFWVRNLKQTQHYIFIDKVEQGNAITPYQQTSENLRHVPFDYIYNNTFNLQSYLEAREKNLTAIFKKYITSALEHIGFKLKMKDIVCNQKIDIEHYSNFKIYAMQISSEDYNKFIENRHGYEKSIKYTECNNPWDLTNKLQIYKLFYKLNIIDTDISQD